MMRVSGEGVTFIQQREGFSSTLYHCPAGVLTIGYGHAVFRGEDYARGITKSQARDLLVADLVEVETSLARLIRVSLTQGQFDALASFTFNLGSGALQRSRLRAVINRGEHAIVPPEMLRWVWANGKVLAGLLERRKAEARMYEMASR